MLSLFSSSPPTVRTQTISDELLASCGITLDIRREDDIHPLVSGNKYRKLKYNLLAAKEQGLTKLVTFGGAYSNHIAATACAAQEMGFDCIGIIRGDELADKWQHNPTLALAHAQGMQLHFVSRADYRSKHETAFIDKLQQQFGAFYLIPEGGTNALAVTGCEEILSTEDVHHYDVVCCAVGTGGTLAGLINSVQHDSVQQSKPHAHTQVVGFAALNAPSLQQDIENLIQPDATHWTLNFDYTFGGYAKRTDALMEFIHAFKTTHRIPLEPIYTGKMLYGIYDLARQGYFDQYAQKNKQKGTRILAIHTGGLQGLKGISKTV